MLRVNIGTPANKNGMKVRSILLGGVLTFLLAGIAWATNCYDYGYNSEGPWCWSLSNTLAKCYQCCNTYCTLDNPDGTPACQNGCIAGCEVFCEEAFS